MSSFALSRAGVWCAVLFLIALACALPRSVSAAELLFSPASGSHASGSEFTVQVMVNPSGDSINAADGTISFTNDTISVVRISRDNSAFSLWTSDPSFSNSAGTITFSGGSPSAFSNQRQVIAVTFRATGEGTATLSFEEGSILAADGMGTDVYESGRGASFTITGAAAAPAPTPRQQTPVQQTGVRGQVPEEPAIRSATHDDSDGWYATSTVQVSWVMPAGITGVRLALSQDEEEEPETAHGAIESHTFEDVEDGIWYVAVQFRNSFGWGEIGRKRIQIDTAPPEPFDVALIDGDEPKFSFQAEDALSGVERYEVMLGERVVATVRPQDMPDGMFTIPPQEGGLQLVTVRAHDAAGNIQEASRQMELPLVERQSAGQGEEEGDEPLITLERVLLLLFVFSTGSLAAWNYFSRKSAQEERSRILQEVSEIRDIHDRVFSAMREEFEQMINDLDEKPQLTPVEREFLENVKEVLDLSEEVIDSDIEDLKKSIRRQ